MNPQRLSNAAKWKTHRRIACVVLQSQGQGIGLAVHLVAEPQALRDAQCQFVGAVAQGRVVQFLRRLLKQRQPTMEVLLRDSVNSTVCAHGVPTKAGCSTQGGGPKVHHLV